MYVGTWEWREDRTSCLLYQKKNVSIPVELLMDREDLFDTCMGNVEATPLDVSLSDLHGVKHGSFKVFVWEACIDQKNEKVVSDAIWIWS